MPQHYIYLQSIYNTHYEIDTWGKSVQSPANGGTSAAIIVGHASYMLSVTLVSTQCMIVMSLVIVYAGCEFGGLIVYAGRNFVRNCWL